MNKRVVYLDLLKAISIFLVVFCHFVLLSPSVFSNVCMAACWMAVPTFFMVNGALLFTRPLDLKRHGKKMLTVYVVLVVWKLIYMLAIPAAVGEPLQAASVWEVLNYLFLFGELPGVVNGHLWFIEGLLAVYAVFPLARIAFSWQEGGRKVIWGTAVLALACTNGLHSFEIFGNMLRSAGLPFGLSADSLIAFQPFGKYGNMLGFFLLGALLHTKKRPLFGAYRRQRLFAAAMLSLGLAALWGVKWFLSGQKGWDGVLLQEGYRHVPVIFMACGLFLLCQGVEIRWKWLDSFVRALAGRTLGIFYLHWLFGWLLAAPLTGLFVQAQLPFGVGTNTLKTIALIAPSFLLTWILEKIPVVKKLVTG